MYWYLLSALIGCWGVVSAGFMFTHVKHTAVKRAKLAEKLHIKNLPDRMRNSPEPVYCIQRAGTTIDIESGGGENELEPLLMGDDRLGYLYWDGEKWRDSCFYSKAERDKQRKQAACQHENKTSKDDGMYRILWTCPDCQKSWTADKPNPKCAGCGTQVSFNSYTTKDGPVCRDCYYRKCSECGSVKAPLYKQKCTACLELAKKYAQAAPNDTSDLKTRIDELQKQLAALNAVQTPNEVRAKYVNPLPKPTTPAIDCTYGSPCSASAMLNYSSPASCTPEHLQSTAAREPWCECSKNTGQSYFERHNTTVQNGNGHRYVTEGWHCVVCGKRWLKTYINGQYISCEPIDGDPLLPACCNCGIPGCQGHITSSGGLAKNEAPPFKHQQPCKCESCKPRNKPSKGGNGQKVTIYG